MPLYFVHFTSADHRYEDVEGIELADDAAACDYAIRDARYLMDEGLVGQNQWPCWKVEVVDGAGRRLLVLTFAEIEAGKRRVH